MLILRALAPLFLIAAEAAQPPATAPPSTYALGPEDQIAITVLNGDEIFTKEGKDPAIKIDSRGDISFPLIGVVHAAGLTTRELSAEIQTRLTKFFRRPDVTVNLVELRSQPISVLGAVQLPGIHQVQGRKTLFEALSLAGGLKNEAGYSIKITRRLEWGRIPLPTAQDDATGQFSVASLNVKDIMAATHPEYNILVQPNDVISVPRADLIYVVGAVRKAGGFTLGEHETISALQALSLAEGHERNAALKRARIMREAAGTGERVEIAVDLDLLMKGKGVAPRLQPEDILFVPVSGVKNAALRGLDAALQVGTGIAIYRR